MIPVYREIVNIVPTVIDIGIAGYFACRVWNPSIHLNRNPLRAIQPPYIKLGGFSFLEVNSYSKSKGIWPRRKSRIRSEIIIQSSVVGRYCPAVRTPHIPNISIGAMSDN
jgi:hypothetical protein